MELNPRYTAAHRASNNRAVKKYRKTDAGRAVSKKVSSQYYHKNGGYEKRKQQELAIKIEVFSHYCGGKPRCVCCNERGIEFLTVDHIKGGGAKHRREVVRGGVVFYRWLKLQGYPKGYRILCYNCNCATHIYGICPHQRT